MTEQSPVSAPEASAPTWSQALHLYKRLTEAPTAQAPDERTLRRLQEWRAEMAAPDEATFAAQLAKEGLTPQVLAGLLTEPAEDLRTRSPEPLPWLADLYSAYGHTVSGRLFADAQLANVGFPVLVEPLLLWARDELQAQLAPLLADAAVPFTFDVAQHALLDALLQQLPPLIDRALVLELNVARLQGLLVGETAGERFVAFLRRLREPDVALAFFAEYPVLARQLVTKVHQTSAALVEILTHLVADWVDPLLALRIMATLAHWLPWRLAGDTHRDGRRGDPALCRGSAHCLQTPFAGDRCPFSSALKLAQ
ncbi:MAG: hypothetical protein R2932_21500 [Caldilineaceae bacterium]